MIELPLTQGKVALIDDRDAHFAAHKWFAQRTKCGVWYARRNSWDGGKHRVLLLHREILGVTDPAVQVDHKSGDGLDCRRDNMRVATVTRNRQNTRRRSDNTSGHKGVIHERRSPPLAHPWRARIHVDGRPVSLGRFATREEAIEAYRAAARRHFGEFACVDR